MVQQFKMTTLRVRFGKLAEFYQTMGRDVIPLVNNSNRQRLVGGFQAVTGDSYYEIIHIWEVEDANAHVLGLLDPADPTFVKVCSLLEDLVVEEGSNLIIKTPYSP